MVSFQGRFIWGVRVRPVIKGNKKIHLATEQILPGSEVHPLFGKHPV